MPGPRLIPVWGSFRINASRLGRRTIQPLGWTAGVKI